MKQVKGKKGSDSLPRAVLVLHCLLFLQRAKHNGLGLQQFGVCGSCQDICIVIRGVRLYSKHLQLKNLEKKKCEKAKVFDSTELQRTTAQIIGYVV